MQNGQKQDVNLLRLMERFHSEEKCRDYLAAIRWPNGVACPRCGTLESHAYDSERYVWDCYSCGYQFSALSGTMFHDTKLPIRKWLMAVLLMVEAKKGISAMQLKRTLGVSYKTAWYLCHRIRVAMGDGTQSLLSGIVEADEIWLGGHTYGKKGDRSKKTIVVGVVEREGEVRLQVAKRVDRETLHGFIRIHVDPATQRIMTDSWPAYRGIGDYDTKHESVDHNIKEWVRYDPMGDVHTQTIEGVWSLLKRSIMGSYHKLSTKHLPAYLRSGSGNLNRGISGIAA